MADKANILTKIPFIGAPVAASLRELKEVVEVSPPSLGF